MAAEKEQDNNTTPTDTPKPAKKAKKKTKKAKDAPTISAEDEQLKAELEQLVTILHDPNKTVTVQHNAVKSLKDKIIHSTSSMTSVPKPLKFLKPHYAALKDDFKTADASYKVDFANVLSMLGTTLADDDVRECLRFKYDGGFEDLEIWGHEYVRHLTTEIAAEYHYLVDSEDAENKTELIAKCNKLADTIVTYYVKHNLDPEACDLLLELERIPDIVAHCDKLNYSRVTQYLIDCAKYLAEPKDLNAYKVVFDINMKQNNFPQALRLALKMNDMKTVKSIFFNKDLKDTRIINQMGFILGRHHAIMEEDDLDEFEDRMDDDEIEQLSDIIGNMNLSKYYLSLAKAQDCLEPKLPEDIYKSKLNDSNATSSTTMNSARKNLAASYVNAFVNAGFGTDKLITPDINAWLYKNKDHGMTAAAASLGAIYLWDSENLNTIFKWLNSGSNYIKSGALLGIGTLCCGLKSDIDPAKGLLEDYLVNKNRECRIGSILGFGLAYGGTAREDLQELLVPLLADSDESLEISAFAALSLGLIFVSTCNEEIVETITFVLMERTEKELSNRLARFFCLAIGLLFLGKQDKSDAILEVAKTLDPRIREYLSRTVLSCAYSGTGNVLKIQELYHTITEYILKDQHEQTEKAKQDKKDKQAAENKKLNKDSAAEDATSSSSSSSNSAEDEEEEKKKEKIETDNNHEGIDVIGLALIAMGENIGSDMVIRSFQHLLQYGNTNTRRAIPLALGIINISHPTINVIDTLGKLSHDHDEEVALSAILSLGLVGAGSTNARIGVLLRDLAQYYSNKANHLFVVRLAQGLLFLGKGLLTLNPRHSDGLIMSNVAVGGLLVVLHSCLDIKNFILGKYHYLMYFLVCAMNPRMVLAVDAKLEPITTNVRIGQAVDTVGLAGNPRRITGFHTHETPVILQHGERCELANDDYTPTSDLLEGVIILQKKEIRRQLACK